MQNKEYSQSQIPKYEVDNTDEACETQGNLLTQYNQTQIINVKPFDLNQETSTSQKEIDVGQVKKKRERNLIFPIEFFNSKQVDDFEGDKVIQDDFNLKNESKLKSPLKQQKKEQDQIPSFKDIEMDQISNYEISPAQKILKLNLQSNQHSQVGEIDSAQKENKDYHNIFQSDQKIDKPKTKIHTNILKKNLTNPTLNHQTTETVNFQTNGSFQGIEENKIQINGKSNDSKAKGLFQKKKNKILWLFRIAKTQDNSSAQLKKSYIGILKRKIRILIYILRFYEIIKDINKEIVQKKNQSDFKRKMTSHIYRRYTWFPLFPNDPFKNFWNVVLFISLILMSFITPFTVCIVDNYNEDSVWFALDTLFDIIFGFDIIINFLSAYQNDKSKIIQNYKEIIKNYITGWFIIDIIAIIPFNALTNGSSTYNKLVRLLRLPRLYNLAKLIKLNRAGSDNLITKIQDRLKMNIASRQLLNLFFLTLIASHLISCLWFLTARLDDFSERTWVYRKGIIDSNYGIKYMTCLYWAFQTLFVIGYGDLKAFTMNEQLVSILWMIFSVGFYSFVISNLSSLIIQANKKQTMLKDTLDSIDQIQAKCKLPPTLVKKIKKFYETNYDFNIFFPFLESDKSVLLDDMWDNIKQEVILLSQIEYLNKIDIFKVNFIFSSHILPYLKMQKFKENEMIYRKDDSSEEIFFLTSGEVCLIDSNNDIMLKIKSGSMFGEVEVIDKQNRRDFCKCITDCVILLIEKETFLKEMDKFENLKDEILAICKNKRKLIDNARHKIVLKRLQSKLQKEGGQSHKEQEKRDSIFEEQSGVEFSMQKKKLPNSSRHYFLFLKAYNKYREKLTKKKLNIVYSEMFEEDVEQKSDSEGNDEIFEAEQEEYDEQEEVDSDAYRKMYTTKLSRKKNTLTGKSTDNMFEEYKNQLKRHSQKTIKIQPEKKPKQKEGAITPESNATETYQNSKSIPTNIMKQDAQGIQDKDDATDNNGKVKFANDEQSKSSSKSSESSESKSDDSSGSEDVDDFNNAYDQYQTQENNTNILQAKLKKIKNNVQIIQRLKQQYDLLVREVNLKKNALIEFNQKYSTNKQDNK